MDQPPAQSQSQPPPPTSTSTSTPGHRDMVFCHECSDEWYRDESGLTCPQCGSDFTEIIEDDNDPRDAGHEDDNDNDSIPGHEAPPPLHPLHGHNPWHNDDDPDEGDISNLQWRQVGPGRFAVSMNRTITPQTPGGAAGAIGGFATLLNSIIGGGVLLGHHRQLHERNQDEQGEQGDQSTGERNTPGASTGSGTLPGGHRFTYSASSRLIPRDTDHAAHLHPQDEMNNVLVGIMAAFGEAPMHRHNREFGDEDHDHAHPHNPLLALLAQMMPGHGQAGDFVYSQEGLDRIITQLMEQTATSTAPGPAPQSEIDALPRKDVTADMLGSEGRAECSICMDEVNIGEQVTELPCHHWFHHQCVAAWLSEHDTCPHCRKGISKSSSNENAPASGDASGAEPSRRMPGAFGPLGENTHADPFVVHESPLPNAQGRDDNPPRPSSADDASSGGFGDRIRRGWFGPPR